MVENSMSFVSSGHRFLTRALIGGFLGATVENMAGASPKRVFRPLEGLGVALCGTSVLRNFFICFGIELIADVLINDGLWDYDGVPLQVTRGTNILVSCGFAIGSSIINSLLSYFDEDTCSLLILFCVALNLCF